MIPKFRAWDKCDDEMVTDIHFSWQDCGYESLNDVFSDNRWVFMQSTGLKDKNGVEIFERDVVRWGMYPNSYEPYHRYAVVEISSDIQFRILHYVDSRTQEKKSGDNYVFHYGTFAYRDTENCLEVIGNLFENPELVEG